MTKYTKSCLFCKHIHHEAGYALSELTWDSGVIECKLHREDVCMIGDEIDCVRLGFLVQTAETCNDFELHPDVEKQ